MYQRSADVFLSLPFNIAGTPLFHEFIVQQTGYHPRWFHHILGDTHIYLNHVNQVEEEVSRTPYDLLTVTIDPCYYLDSIKVEYIHLHNYQCHPVISGEMAV